MWYMSSIYDTSIISFVLKISPLEHCVLLLSPSCKSRYGHFKDYFRESVYRYALGLIVFRFFENCNVSLYSY